MVVGRLTVRVAFRQAGSPPSETARMANRVSASAREASGLWSRRLGGRNHSRSNFPEIVLPFAGRKRRLRLETMAHNLTACASGKSAMRPKNRVWGFSSERRFYPLGSRRRCPELRRKSRPTPTNFTPGIPHWPSRDPIGEDGGENLYGFVGNDGIAQADALGLTPEGPVIEYNGKSFTSSCDCPITVKFEHAEWKWKSVGVSTLGVAMDVKMKFKPSDPSDPDCNCLKIRVMQMSGRFELDLKGTAVHEDGNRGARTSRDGWRIDWPDDLETGGIVPFVDNVPAPPNPPKNHVPLSVPWSPGISGTFNDPAAIYTSGTIGIKFLAYTCFFGEQEGGKFKFMGCLHWGFQLTKKGIRVKDSTRDFREPDFKILDDTPTWSCSRPAGWLGAVKEWDFDADSKGKIPTSVRE